LAVLVLSVPLILLQWGYTWPDCRHHVSISTDRRQPAELEAAEAYSATIPRSGIVPGITVILLKVAQQRKDDNQHHYPEHHDQRVQAATHLPRNGKPVSATSIKVAPQVQICGSPSSMLSTGDDGRFDFCVAASKFRKRGSSASR
jgi:hypothetical protein